MKGMNGEAPETRHLMILHVANYVNPKVISKIKIYRLKKIFFTATYVHSKSE